MPQLGFTDMRYDKLTVKGNTLVSSGIIIIVGVIGEIRGNIVYVFDYDAAKKISSKMMMGMPVNEIDDMVRSSLSELTNWLTANATICASNIGISIDISTPTLMQGDNVSVKVNTKKTICIPFYADGIPLEINIAYDD
jgi:chemotaxis protein CheX